MALTAATGREYFSAECRTLRRRLAQVRWRAKSVILAEGLARAALVVLVFGPIALLIDNLFHLPTIGRVFFLLALTAGTVAAFAWRARTALRRWSDERVARRVERFYPELDNRLINALQLSRFEADATSAAIIERVIEDAARYSSRMSFGDAIRVKRLGRAGAALAVLLVIFSIYPLLFPDYFSNAAQRILFPASDIDPLTAILLSVTPDRDVLLARGDALDILADLKKGGSPRKVVVETREEDRQQSTEMRFDGERFSHRIPDVQKPLAFRVAAEDFKSPWRRVRVIDKPRVESLTLTYNFPAYMNAKPLAVENADGVIQGLAGTRVELTALTNKPIDNAGFEMSSPQTVELKSEPFTAQRKEEGGKERSLSVTRLQTSLVLTQNDAYRIRLRDREGYSNDPPPSHAIIVLPDELPRIAITSPSGEAEVKEGGKLTALFTCSDDYGLVEATAVLRKAADTAGGETVYQTKIENAAKRYSGGFDLDLGSYKAGAELALQMFARDTNPASIGAKGESDVVTIRIVSPQKQAGAEKMDAGTVYQRLAALLTDQKDTRGETDQIAKRRAEGKLTESRARSTVPRLESYQTRIRDEAINIASAMLASQEAIPEGDAQLGETRQSLSKLAQDQMTQAAAVLKKSGELTDLAALGRMLTQAISLQDEIIKELERLLKVVGEKAGMGNEKKEELAQEVKPAEESPEQKVRKYIEGLANKLGEFADFDRKAIEATRELAQKKPEDLTKDEQEKLNDIQATREDWAQFFRNVFSDLSKLPAVDPVDSALKEEIVEIYSEIEQKSQESQSEKKEIFVPAGDQAGGELASELQANLEKWLADEPDKIKWNMEEPNTPAEPPLAELPEELEDLIGDLLESEQDMADDIEDASSSFADSLDKGAGWKTADGPISNYSAQGKTGNMMPNADELSGRSGEGRSGQSNGEFVEQQAYGKGGRKTPTRLGDEAFENGKVEDFSKDPVGGATGGGKESGYGAKGLTSPHDAPMDNTQKRLLDKQADLKTKAAVLEQRLLGHRLPTAELDKAITVMGNMEQAIQTQRYQALPAMHEQVLTNLRDNRTMVNKQIEANREKLRKLPPRFNQDIAQGLRDEFPEGYEDMLKAYYQRLSEAAY